jgi:hypothetical protein
VLFAACAFHVRWRFQMAKANLSNDNPSDTAPATEISK